MSQPLKGMARVGTIEPRGKRRNDDSALQAEVARLTKALRKQGADRRRLATAYAELKAEKRDVHEILLLAEQLQDECERLEAVIAKYEEGSLAQALRDAKRSREALSFRYGHLHRALTALLADSTAKERAWQALRDVDDRNWVRAQFGEEPPA